MAGYNYISTVTASDGAGQDKFGASVALSRDGLVMAVGASDESNTFSWQGAVYIYDWDGTSWVERSKIYASDPAQSDYFGKSCALSADGSILAVGAYAAEGSQSAQGQLYIFDWNGSAWVERGILSPFEVAAYFFGRGCALSGDGNTLVVGASGASSSRGYVYTYDWDGAAWVQRGTYLSAYDAGTSDEFGYACALSEDGTYLAVGAPFWDGAIALDQGAVYVYTRNGTSWDSVKRITASETAGDGTLSNKFGWSCSLSSDGMTMAVGCPEWSAPSPDYSIYGKVYFFQHDGSTWVETGWVQKEPLVSYTYFGTGCALSGSGSVLAVGHERESSLLGAVFMYQKILSISFTLIESLAATTFYAVLNSMTGTHVASAEVTGQSGAIEVSSADPVLLTVFPKIGSSWVSSTSYALNDKVFPTDPTTSPFYYECTTAGTSGSTEPTWPSTGSVVDGTVEWVYVERIVQPITHGPLIPA